jgi:Domain of unknown function (DUF4331)
MCTEKLVRLFVSSHREAPEIAKDPVADSTDVYAFVSPDQPGTVTLIEISPDREPARRRHACVRERRHGSGAGYAAIYDRLPPGRYTIWRDRVTPAATVAVAGGQVTSHDWA